MKLENPLPSPNRARGEGIFFAVTAAVAYGLNPLFALPLYREGFDADTVLLFRYFPAAAMLAVWMVLNRRSFRLTGREFAGTLACGVLFSVSSLCLFQSYRRMDAGVASTLLFVYPMMVALIMAVLFRERAGAALWGSLALALTGTALLCRKADGSLLSVSGVTLVMLSSLSYAVYMVWVNRSTLGKMPVEKLSFYVVLFGILLYWCRLKFGLAIRGNFTGWAWLNIAGLAFFPTVLSLVLTAAAIQRVGPTVTAVLGALEPVTAVAVGVLLFGEVLSGRMVLGILLILAAVVVSARARGRVATE